MPTLNINGQRVRVDDSFLSLTPEQQNATVDEIAESLPAPNTMPAGPWLKYQRAASAPKPRFTGTLVEDAPTPMRKPRFTGTLVEDVPAGPWTKYGKPEAEAAPARDLSWSEIPGQAASNLGSSAGQFASDIVQPFMHPVLTAQALGQVAGGVAAKAGIGNADQTAADNLGAFFVDRYGSMEGVKNTLATDPVGIASDIATVLSGGALLGARAPGVLGTAARAAGTAGKAIDPLTPVVKAGGMALKGAGRGAARVSGVMSGGGGDAVREMVRAGREGNVQALEQLRGTGSALDIVDDARAAFGEMRADRGTQYEADMNPVFADQQPFQLRGVARALSDAAKKVYPTGKLPADTEAASALKQARDMVREMARAKDTTARGLDSLRRRVEELRSSVSGNLAKSILKGVSTSLTDTISRRHPKYRTGLEGFTDRSKALTELTSEFSLYGQNPNTSLRKLLSSFRQNSNLGRRETLVRDLAKKSPQLPGMIAGREMASWEPRGVARLGTQFMFGAPISYGAYMTNPLLLGLLPPLAAASTPRIVGETAYKAGGASRLTPAQVRLLGAGAFQTGRADDRR